MGEKVWRRRSFLAQGHVSPGLISSIGLPLVLLVFLVLSTLYSIVVPITQGEDELAHYRYISFITQNQRLPINSAEREQAWYRSDWPPLYHLLVGWAVSPLDTTRPHLKDVGESPRRRLVGEIFYPRLIIYTEDANWPWQDGILAWHIGRFISIMFAAAALIFGYVTVLELGRTMAARLGFKDPGFAPLLALAATALLAFTPRFLFTSAMLGDDSLFILLSAAFIWLLLRTLGGDDRWRVYAAMGILLGLSITTKYSTGLLPLTIGPVVWWRAHQSGWSWTQSLGRLLWAWLFTLLGASWWFGWIIYYFNTIRDDGLFAGMLRPILASGPDVSMRRVFDFLGGPDFRGTIRPEAVGEGGFWEWWGYLFRTFWGVPVLEYDPAFPWAYLLILLLVLLALVGLWRVWRAADGQSRITLGTLLLIVILLFPFPILRYFLTFNILETGQGRHILYPAAQTIPFLLVLGWVSMLYGFQQRNRGIIDHHPVNSVHQGSNTPEIGNYAFCLLLIPLLLLSWSIFQLAYMAKTYPEPLPVQTTTFDLATIPEPLKQNFGDEIQFLGYDFQPDPELAIINLSLFWKALSPVDENYRTRVQLVDPAGQVHFTWLSHPLNGRYPTRAWDKGDVIRDTLPLPLAAVPVEAYDIQIDLLHEAEDVPLADEAFQIIHFDLGKRQPIAEASSLSNFDYRLWLNGSQTARYRQTIPLSWLDRSQTGEKPDWALLGPDRLARQPAAISDATAIFIVGPNWPSGQYRLGLAGSDLESPLLFSVANDLRLFDLPAELITQPDWSPVEANFADQVELLGYLMPSRRLEPGENLTLTLAWRGLAPVLPDTMTFAVLLDRNQQSFGQIDRYPFGFYSPILWAKDEVVIDTFTLPIRPDTPPGIYFVHVGQYELKEGQPNSLAIMHEGQAGLETAVVIGPFKIGGPPPEIVAQDPSPQVRLDQPVGDRLTLLGYDLNDQHILPVPSQTTETTARNSELPVSSLKVILYWQVQGNLETDYTTFLHLRNVSNETISQKDNPPAGGVYPTSLWEAGEIVVDEIILPLDQTPSGEYTPVVGLYDFESGNRLLVPGTPANEVALQPIQLED